MSTSGSRPSSLPPYRSRRGFEILRTRLSWDAGQAEAELWIPVELAAA
ncbi:hypothetical protein [Streptomyces sp. NPDC059970]